MISFVAECHLPHIWAREKKDDSIYPASGLEWVLSKYLLKTLTEK